MACVVIDEKRRAANRNACCCCYVHKQDYEPNECSKRDLQQLFFERYYGPTIIKLPVKVRMSNLIIYHLNNSYTVTYNRARKLVPCASINMNRGFDLQFSLFTCFKLIIINACMLFCRL